MKNRKQLICAAGFILSLAGYALIRWLPGVKAFYPQLHVGQLTAFVIAIQIATLVFCLFKTAADLKGAVPDPSITKSAPGSLWRLGAVFVNFIIILTLLLILYQTTSLILVIT